MYSSKLFMQRCFELAQKGGGLVAPNPMVGAVLVNEGRIIGEGWHQEFGEAHAEVNCFESVKEEDKELLPTSTLYVSLEPCAHYGKTPPCTLRILQEKIKEVIICNKDPFDAVNGKGIELLQQEGIIIQSGLLKEEGLWLNRRFFCFHQHKRPYIILKWAQTQQGYFAPLDRSRFQMSNHHSQQLVHHWRTQEAAILVGFKTALHDDPQLNARLWQGKQPLRIVFDRTLQLPSTLKMFSDQAPVWVLNELRDDVQESISYVKIDFSENVLQQLFKLLYKANILSLIVEGGAGLLQSFIDEGLWDEARFFETANLLNEGLQAPLLHHAQHYFTNEIFSDKLLFYTQQNPLFPYPSGMPI